MIIAYKDGKWMFKVGKWVYPRDFSRIGMGFDLTAKVVQFDQGKLFFRFRAHHTRMLDIPGLLWGKSVMCWQPMGGMTAYRFKDQVFVMQELRQCEYRARRSPAYRTLPETWWSVVSIDGKSPPSPVFSFQRSKTPLDAMDGYVRMTGMVKLQEGHKELAERARIVFLF